VKASALLCVSWTLGFRDALALGSSVNRGNPPLDASVEHSTSFEFIASLYD
jgi:hypothetical protein